MSDYSNYYIKSNTLFDYKNIKIEYNPIKLNTRTITRPLFKTIDCVKNDNNYDCEITEYSLRVCLKESF
jgi:hypothetical protein